MLNPLVFKTQEEFKKALFEDGIKYGWMPIWTSTKPGTPEELVHFGVKGMRWGIRKEYESVAKGITRLKSRRSIRRERRIKGREANVQRAQAEIDRIRAKPSGHIFVQAHREHQVRELKKYQYRQLKDAKDIREGRLTETQKKALIGAGAVAAVLAVYGTYKFVDSGTARQVLARNVPLKKNDLLSRKMSPDRLLREVVDPVNPNYGELGTKMNCRRCTFAYEMRRRGFDVKSTQTVGASGQTVTGMLNATNPKNDFKTGRFSIFGNIIKEHLQEKGPKTVTEAALTKGGMGDIPIGGKRGDLSGLNKLTKTEHILAAIGKNPEGARGEIGMRWRMGGAHSMAWEIVGGKPVIFDTQTGIKYASREEFMDIADDISNAGITRLDNIPLNEGFLRRWVTNVG